MKLKIVISNSGLILFKKITYCDLTKIEIDALIRTILDELYKIEKGQHPYSRI